MIPEEREGPAIRLLRRSIFVLCLATAPSVHALGADEALLQTLREGALTLYFRHAKTDPAQADRPGAAPEDCARQRNLSDEGRGQARAIGAALRALALSIEEEVPSSPYCRTMETARLIAGRATPSRAILGRRIEKGKVDYSELAGMFRNPPAKGRIRLVVGHGNQLRDMMGLAGMPELAEGEAAIIVGTDASWMVLTTVPASDWTRLAAWGRAASKE